MIETATDYQISLRKMNEMVELLHDLAKGLRGDQCTMINVHRKLSRLHSDISKYLSDTLVEPPRQLSSNENSEA